MRTFSKLRISKGFISGFLNVAVVAGAVALLQLSSPAVEPMGDMGAFIEEHGFVLTEVPVDLPVRGLDAFMEQLPTDAVPVIIMKKKDADSRLSDGNFSSLSVKWKQGVMQVVRDKRCEKHAKAFVPDPIMPPWLQKAHAIVESNCDAKVVGGAGELGIYQVMPKTCRELGVTGDLRDSVVNAECTAKYRKKACASVAGKCTVVFVSISHNRGIRGAKRVSNLHSLEYARKLDYAARAVRKKKRT